MEYYAVSNQCTSNCHLNGFFCISKATVMYIRFYLCYLLVGTVSAGVLASLPQGSGGHYRAACCTSTSEDGPSLPFLSPREDFPEEDC